MAQEGATKPVQFKHRSCLQCPGSNLRPVVGLAWFGRRSHRRGRRGESALLLQALEFQRVLEDLVHDPTPGLHGYMPNAGYPAAREAVACYLSEDQGIEVPGENIVMTCGAGGPPATWSSARRWRSSPATPC